MTEQELGKKTNLTDEEKAQIFLMDFEQMLFNRCPTCHQLRKTNWSPNKWGAKLTAFIKEAGYVKLADDQDPPVIDIHPIALIPIANTDMGLQITSKEQQDEIDQYLISDEEWEECGDDEDKLIKQHNKSVTDMLKVVDGKAWRKVEVKE